MHKVNNMTEFSIREDVSFRWEEFRVVVEYCDVNVQKVALYAVDGIVKNSIGNQYSVSESNEYPVKIEYDRIGDLIHSLQRETNLIVRNISYGQLNYLYIFTDQNHGSNQNPSR